MLSINDQTTVSLLLATIPTPQYGVVLLVVGQVRKTWKIALFFFECINLRQYYLKFSIAYNRKEDPFLDEDEGKSKRSIEKRQNRTCACAEESQQTPDG